MIFHLLIEALFLETQKRLWDNRDQYAKSKGQKDIQQPFWV